MTQIDDGLILDHASGTAPAALSVLALAQAELRPVVARRIALAESAFGALLESEDTQKIDARIRERVMARIGRVEPEPARREPRGNGELLPAALADRLLVRDKGLRWKRRAGGRAEIRIDALCQPGVEASLIRLDPGRAIPTHDHEGDEYTLVLAGAFSDARARYERGDVCTAGPGLAHSPRVETDALCVCFAVSLGRMQFRNPLIAAYDRFLARHP